MHIDDVAADDNGLDLRYCQTSYSTSKIVLELKGRFTVMIW